MSTDPIIVLITVPNKDVGRTIARALVEQKLAACVNMLTGPVESVYTWQNQVNEEEEYLLVCKTRSHLFEERIIPAVRSLHPYDVPEIIALPIQAGSKDYLGWITENTLS